MNETQYVIALVVLTILAFWAGLAAGSWKWQDKGRCDKILGSEARITSDGAREVTVTCLVERVEP